MGKRLFNFYLCKRMRDYVVPKAHNIIDHYIKYFIGLKSIMLREREGDSKNFHPEEMIIDRGEAKVNNHFRRMKLIINTLSAMLYLFYHTKIVKNKRNAIQFKRVIPILA